MKVLFIEPGATWATADVASGLRYGLEAHGVTIVPFRLERRIPRAASWLHYNWKRAKRLHPEIPRPNDADMLYQAGESALAMALRHQVDVVLSVSGMLLHPDIIILMKRAGLRVVLAFTESPYDMPYELRLAAMVDGCWTNERAAVDAFRAVNPRVGYLPHAWHPERHRPGVQEGDETVAAHDVVFVGTDFHERTEWLAAIDWTGIDLGLYGSWRSLASRHPLRRYIRGGNVDNPQTAALYRRAKIGLNLYRTSQGWGKQAPPIEEPAESLNPRAYELAACGIFHLSTDRAEVRELFGERVPILSPDPAISTALIRHWLAETDARTLIAEQLPGCVAEHSWTNRARTVIGDLQMLLKKTSATGPSYAPRLAQVV